MPFMLEYACEYGHRFDHLEMGSREDAKDYIPCEGWITKQDGEAVVVQAKCPRLAEKVVSAVRAKTVVRGNGDFLEREKERLTKRSQEYDKSSAGKNAKMEATERRIKNGGLF